MSSCKVGIKDHVATLYKSAQERASKAARERDRSRRYRSAARQNNDTLSGGSHPHVISSHPSNFPENPLMETAREESSLLTLLRNINNNRSITTTHEPPTIQVDETALQPDVSTQSIGQYADSHAICIAAQYPGTTTHQDAATIEDEAESTSATEPSSLYLPIQVERQAIYRPGRPQKDPALSPHARTRLRVQQYRDQLLENPGIPLPLRTQTVSLKVLDLKFKVLDIII
ncbi:uncharacterized protein FOBCDRAFT_203916 [Fusarium oxysporum Fo47]|uniref:uncharacterized protein n=1 Tax=Fusarium oxysporum Fo47 TaxID=660027 RepID=UPI0028699C6C|nr:uncharacterized protein FOBCDRAFT_203916 [Fusarium oxysporum Fo47]QKD56865.2 hypothetical protein FOBCDRAFT_203916 [Fusarium oxysporum Fo47]